MSAITERDIELVQTTWGQVVPIADDAVALFYKRLLELDPDLETLFKSDIKEQGKKLAQMLSFCVNGLKRLESIVPVVEDLGKRHTDYGVKDEDYDTVAEALLWTLGKGLGDGFTDEVKEAWTKTYGTLASVMKSAAATV